MSAFGQSVDNSLAHERNARRRREGCPECRALPEEADNPAALGCGNSRHRGEPGRLPNADLTGVVPLPGGLCRCMTCCCKPGEGHNHPAWQVYEREQRALERYQDALASGLSDYEARAEGWPAR